MGRRSMDELLTAFDPLHSSSASGSVQAGPSRSPAREASSSMDNSSSFSAARHAQASQHAAIPLSQAPLDLLSLDDGPRTAQPWPSTSASAAGAHPQGPAAISRQPVQGGLQANASHDIQARAAKRQDGLLSELHNADQTFTIPSSHASTSASTHGQGHAAASPPAARPGTRHRRTSSGFSPPRRMSRSGLMHDEHAINQLRAAHQHPGPPHLPMDGGFVPSSPSTSLTEEPAVLFHPFSPPDGTTLETLRNSDYFPAQHAPYTRTTIPPPHAASNSNYSTADRPVSTGERQRRTSSSDRQALRAFRDGESQTSDNQVGGISTETTKKQPSNRTAFIQNTLRGPLPPFSSPSLKQTTSSQAQPIPSTSNAHPPSASPQPSVNAPSSPSSRFKSIRKATFDFPSFSSLGSSVPTSSGKGSSIPAQPPQTKSGSNTPSPANSLVIDSDPLPSLTLKVSGSARESRRVLTEDIADGIRTALPPRIKLCKSWTLLYSIDAHGTSLTTLYTRVQAGLQKSAGGCVLVVKDMEGGIFGAYVNEAFKRSESYYGNGECFIWKVESFPPGDNFRVGPIVCSYRWTARNDYIILSDSSFLGIGGGDGKFGLWLDSSFDKGFTTSCPAFANEPLCSDSLIRPGVDGNPEGKFDIMAVECWAVG